MKKNIKQSTKVKKVIDEKVKTIKKAALPVDNIPVVTQRVYTARKIASYIILASVMVAIAVLTFFAKQNPYFAFDLRVTEEVQEFNAVWFDMLMNFLTFLGNPGISPLFVLLTSGLFFLKKRQKESCMILFSSAGAALISISMKAFVHRVRPNPQLIHQVNRYMKPDSFPSGHVLFYVGFFGFIFYLTFALLKTNKFRIIFLIILGSMLTLIGMSRIYLGAHWFSDVTGAYLIGFVWLTIVIFIYNKWQPKVGKS